MNNPMNPFSIPNFVAAAAILSLGIFVGTQTRGRWNERILSFIGFCLVTSLWQFTYGIAYNSKAEEVALTFIKIGYCGVVLCQ